MKYYNNIIG